MLPSSPEARFATALDDQACREAIRTGSRSFFTASWLLPESVRRPAFGLYAFCRLSDDAVDLGENCDDEIARLRIRLDRVYAGRPADHPADRSMADIVRAFHIPRQAPEALLEGLAWDCAGRRFETIEDLHAYAARVAASVGVMMTLLMGVRDPAALARACDLGVAMQLTNIARDVGEDARNGRCYLPLRWLAEAGLDAEAFVENPAPGPALASVVARMLAEADRLYQRARDGVARLPLACRPAILAAAVIYAEIGREVEKRDYDCVDARARVAGSRKVALLLQSCLQAPTLTAGHASAPLESTAFLVESVHPLRVQPRERYTLRGHMLRVLAIFERLERAQQIVD